MRIGDAAAAAGTTPRALRFYEQRGLLPPPRRTRTGQRLYGEQEVILMTSDPADTGITAGILQTSLTIGGSIGLAVLLLPYSSGTGNPADTISTVFLWATGIAILGLLATLLFWFGPGTRKKA